MLTTVQTNLWTGVRRENSTLWILNTVVRYLQHLLFSVIRQLFPRFQFLDDSFLTKLTPTKAYWWWRRHMCINKRVVYIVSIYQLDIIIFMSTIISTCQSWAFVITLPNTLIAVCPQNCIWFLHFIFFLCTHSLFLSPQILVSFFIFYMSVCFIFEILCVFFWLFDTYERNLINSDCHNKSADAFSFIM